MKLWGIEVQCGQWNVLFFNNMPIEKKATENF